MFKKTFYSLLAAATAAVTLSCSNLQSKPQAFPVKEGKGIHVIELFTSEGCSSCPPADRLLSKLKAEGDSNVFVLSYHVDYWDRLGWKDPFSRAAFTQRQGQYAQRFGLDGSYTPQMIVNGEEEFVGSDEKRLRTSLAKTMSDNVAVKAGIATTDKREWQLVYSLSSATGLTLNVALVQAEAVTDVKRGENGGRTLRHVNVVRELKTVEAQATGRLIIPVSDETKNLALSLIVFAQQKSSGRILGAAQVAVPLQKGV